MSTAPADITVSQHDTGGFDRLLHRLASQNRPSPDGPIKPDADGRNILRMLLQEVDETVLPRQLTLNCRPAGTVSVIASNRRLTSVTFSNALQPSDATVPSGPVELAEYYAETLSRVFARCRDVEFFPPERVDALDGTNCSCSAQLVAQAADLDCFDVEPSHSIDGLVAELKSVAKAWVAFDAKGRTACHGRDAYVDLLEETYKTFRAKAPPSGRITFRAHEAECMTIQVGNKDSLVLCTGAEANFLALLPTEHALSIWEK